MFKLLGLIIMMTYLLSLQSYMLHRRSPMISKRLVGSMKWDLKEMKNQISKAGQAGILAYGTLNCIYYLTVTGFVWRWTARDYIVSYHQCTSLSSKISCSLSRLGKVSLAVWAGSQVTKLFRLATALALSPAIDKLIDKVQGVISLENRNTAFWIIVTALWGIVVAFYSILIASTLVLKF